MNIKPAFKRTNVSLLLMTGCFVAWAGYFEVDQTVQAHGQVLPPGKTQWIQATDGGVVKQFTVKEGDLVQRGDRVAMLESNRAGAAFNEVQAQINNLEIAQIRAKAEAQGLSPVFGDAGLSQPETARIQQAQHEQSLQSLKKDLMAFGEAEKLAEEERALTLKLYQQGDVSRIDLMRAERQSIDLAQRRSTLTENFKTEARKEAARLQVEIVSMKNRLKEKADVLGHTDLYSNSTGTVQFLKTQAVGAVLRPGEELMQITPNNAPMVWEIKITPADIGPVTVGLSTNIRMDAWDYSIYGSLKGKISYISADTSTESGPNGGSYSYYRAHVQLDENQENKRLKIADLKPGMSFSADLKTGERSLLKYLISPVANSLATAMSQK